MRPARGTGRLAAVALVAAVIAGCGSDPRRPAAAVHCLPGASAHAVGRSTTGGPPAVPASGAYLGAFALTGPATQAGLVSSYRDLQRMACGSLGVAHVYLRWGTSFPTPSARALTSAGQPLLVSWTGTDMAAMASGSEDATITATARQVAALHTPVFLELRWEMDRPNLAATVHSPSTFVAAWDRARALFAAAGVHNASWVWCPTSEGFANGRAQPFYPGDAAVDWVCTDAYPRALDLRHRYPSLEQLVRPFLTWSQQHPKPVMIGEFAIPQGYPPAERAAWLREAHSFLVATPRIKAALLFDADDPARPVEQRFRLGTSPSVTAALRELATDPLLRLRLGSSAGG